VLTMWAYRHCRVSASHGRVNSSMLRLSRPKPLVQVLVWLLQLQQHPNIELSRQLQP
jgi:hypothetical protein